MKLIKLILITLLLVPVFNAQTLTHNISGRVVDKFGRAVRSVKIRSQATVCDGDPEHWYVTEDYAYTNTFGYYTLRPRADCGVYSVRILGAARHPEEYFTPRIYSYGNPNRESLTLVFNFTYVGYEAQKKGKIPIRLDN